MEDFFKKSSLNAGAKGLVFIGDKALIYRRDDNTRKHPLQLDVPGGESESDESPFETFQRETKEEFDLDIYRDHIIYTRKYITLTRRGIHLWFAVAQLPQHTEEYIRLGDEGVEYMLMHPEEYVKRQDGWPLFQNRASKYIKTTNRGSALNR